MSSNAKEVIRNLRLTETCLESKSEEGIPVYCQQRSFVAPNSMRFVKVMTKGKVGTKGVLFEPVETHRFFQ